MLRAEAEEELGEIVNQSVDSGSDQSVPASSQGTNARTEKTSQSKPKFSRHSSGTRYMDCKIFSLAICRIKVVII